ncbi:MAG TPA: UPF0182 family protein [Bryobacteraceae bacterium]|nr:UPF0182 family protein [Bryobacteraceae bacterium]
MQPSMRNSGRRAGRSGVFVLVGLLLALLFCARLISSFVIEYAWWTETGQIETWESILLYRFLPLGLATVLAFAVLWTVHARALKFAGTGLREHKGYASLSTVAILLLSLLIARACLDSWTVVTFYGSQRAGVPANTWRDPVFGNPLPFYLFDLPFYSQLLTLVFVIALIAALLFYITARIWQLARQRSRWQEQAPVEFQPRDLLLKGGFESVILRTLAALTLVIMAGRAWLGRYDLLDDDHGFLVGIDYLAQHVTLPLQYASIVVFLLAAALVLARRWTLAVAGIVLMMVIKAVVPAIVSAAYVKPNEISLQRPYIRHHIDATRSAYGLQSQLKEVSFPAKLEQPINVAANRALLDNVRLWDWRAFHDTVTQVQALRQYYVFPDTDVDRYMIDGKLRQVLLTPRELDIRQLPDARGNWINAHFIYTHGYGMVMAEANQITPTGQPVLFVQDAPPKISSSSLKLTRPEIYFGEVVHEPVFVRTAQPEFNYPAGAGNVHTRYEGRGGIPVGSLPMRLAAALALGDRNVLLTGYLTGESRMMIHRNVRQRVEKLASFIHWDTDPYLTLTDDGRLVWVIDGYTTSDRHPYARRVRLNEAGSLNYIRNSVKATVDAYDGSVRMYVFDPADPVIRAFGAMFPDLFTPGEQMPADLREHVRYPEVLFRTQAEIYRTYHMLDPESFYNREDLWDVAKNVYAQSNQPEALPPTFVVATLPGETEPEFLLIQAFTPRNKDNLIGLMVARSDAEHLGEIVVLQLSKQSLIYGPLQVEARIDSDANISKDLSLWNQQGSQVLRGHMLVLPIQETFLYVEPIYIQSAQARMPQLKKVVLAMGNTLIYRDTYEEALAALASGAAPPQEGTAADPQTSTAAAQPQQAASAAAPASDRIGTIRNHLRRYRELTGQGRWSEAGRELEALEKLVSQQ